MNKNKKYKITWDGKYLHVGVNTLSSIPEVDEDCSIAFSKSGEANTLTVYKSEKGLYGEFDSYDKYFKDEEELVDFLNEHNYQYVGIEDRN